MPIVAAHFFGRKVNIDQLITEDIIHYIQLSADESLRISLQNEKHILLVRFETVINNVRLKEGVNHRSRRQMSVSNAKVMDEPASHLSFVTT